MSLTDSLAKQGLVTEEVYLDYAAATPMDAAVIAAQEPYLADIFYNPSAAYAKAREAKDALENAKADLAQVIGAKADQIVLCAGATEANNLALVSAAASGKILSSAAEHDSVQQAALALGGELIAVDAFARPKLDDLETKLTDEVSLVSISLVNGELGSIAPIRKIADLIQKRRTERLRRGLERPLLLHVDASQAAGHCSLSVSNLHVDLMTLSAAKIYGPKQVGLLWAKEGVKLLPLLHGGGQEAGLRSGTENVAGAVAFAKALELAEATRLEENRRLEALRSSFIKQIKEALPWLEVNGPKKAKDRVPNILHLSLPGLDARRLIILLERRGVYVATGAACAASKMKYSPILQAIGASEAQMKGSLRLSFGRPTTETQLNYAALSLIAVVKEEASRLGFDAATGPNYEVC